jgi:ankyrin repeat protein
MNQELPAQPSLEQLRKQAKDLLKAHRDGETAAANRVREALPHLGEAALKLGDAQSVIAREYSFPSWTRLKAEVERRAATWEEAVAKFIRDAVGQPDEAARARAAMEERPEFAGASFWTALVAGRTPRVAWELERDPGLADRVGGPQKGWRPLHYVAFSRLQMESAERLAAAAECARRLVAVGADPSAAWENEMWPGAPFRALYGATGVNNNPLLARVLLEAGALIDDGESIFHAAEHYHLECLEVLKEFGASLGKNELWGNTPVHFLLVNSPNHGNWPTIRRGMRWLLDQGCDPNILCGEEQETALHNAVRGGHKVETLRMLAEAGADVNLPRKDGYTPLALALLYGQVEAAEFLRSRGAREPELGAKERFLAAAARGDAEEAARWSREIAGFPESFTEEEKLSLNRAATAGNVAAIRVFLDNGFGIAYKGTQNWGATPLHLAAWNGRHAAVKLLLERGAPVDVRANPPETGQPLDWAAHGSGFCRAEGADYAEITRLLLAAGAEAGSWQADMASAEVAAIIRAHLAGKEAP